MTSPNYWEDEKPIIVRTTHNTFRWFEHAGKLQICMPDYIRKNGQTMPGKTIGILIADVISNDSVKALLREALGL